MSQEIEIEFKNILTEAEYLDLKASLMHEHDHDDEQTNYYFDTPQSSLKELESALRIRKKKDSYTFTLKEPHTVGLLETHQQLTEHEAMNIINEGLSPNGPVTRRLNEILSDQWAPLDFIGELTTYRLEKRIPQGLLVLDKSFYLNKIDYELEFECSDVEKGHIFFQDLLNKQGIPKRMTLNKIQRFMIEKRRLENSKEEQDET